MILVLLAGLSGASFFGFSGSLLTGIPAYAGDTDGIPVKVLILPKFEIGDIDGDFPGEAQLFYEHYCAGCEEITVPTCLNDFRLFIKSPSDIRYMDLQGCSPGNSERIYTL